MKQLLLFIFITLNFSPSAQTDEYSGTYNLHIEGKDGNILDYNLVLNKDHTFMFVSFQKLIDIRGEQNKYNYGKGTWKVENKIIYFTTESADLDEKHTMNFTGTTARIIKKSPRDTSDKVVPTSLQFYKSEISLIANLKLLLKG
ncbi:hypothetical protein ACSVH2_06605 [Flavobacterium sp. RSB2_4_14]|uniref:hypothetical protein n=1 Tax=Flavobacterium sp. RSB2_4_14 TaxID=3447665 RepID=UPI003F37C1A2